MAEDNLNVAEVAGGAPGGNQETGAPPEGEGPEIEENGQAEGEEPEEEEKPPEEIHRNIEDKPAQK